MAESFVDTFKTELIRDRVWPTRDQLEFAIVEYLGWFNHDRLHSSLGDIPPAEFEALHAPRFFSHAHSSMYFLKQQSRTPRNPVRLMSGGRLTAGLGMGWLPQEYAAAGVPYERRGERMDEYLRCLEALWTQDPVEFAGEFYTVPRSHVGPPPVQRPHPPVLLGGAAAPALRRAGRLAQGWICSSRQDLTNLGASIETVRDGAREAGRDPEAVRIVVRGVVDLVDDDPGGSADRSRGRGSRCSTISRHWARRASRRSSLTSTSHPGSTSRTSTPGRRSSTRSACSTRFAPTRLRPSA